MRMHEKYLINKIYLRIIEWIYKEIDTLLEIYESDACTEFDKPRFMARISELEMAKSAIVNIFLEERDNE